MKLGTLFGSPNGILTVTASSGGADTLPSTCEGKIATGSDFLGHVVAASDRNGARFNFLP